MIFGLYKHHKGGWYLGLWKVWESTNYYARKEKVLYFSFKQRSFNVRDIDEFFSTVYDEARARLEYDYVGGFRFKKLGNSCYCRYLGAYQECPKHGHPKYGNHMVLKRFDGHEHERDPYRDIKSAVDKLDKEGHLK